MTRVGIIGAGHIGSTLAKGLVARGYDVAISNSRGPETLAELAADIGAQAMTPTDAAAFGDWAVVTVPMQAIDTLPVAELAGKTVVDTNNYYWERDGRIEALEAKQTTTSQLLQERLPESAVVKGFNHIMASQILTDGSPAGTDGRRALATASDADDAVAFITALYDEFGYDTVNIGALADSWRVERDQPAYVVAQTADELRANLARAER
ncbi:NADPH-dependent F420 reductase [Microbacterium dauci]|uniref:NAD(P)-binding domain-containing protein n=1 Tax=Microbacterium dauci TaxID=3048008 RepID=A0ABT6ZDH5_9MICO|nr:NAD(P)-binding domain-containing protein [Microbacterium sp. LX3-4]MDJ1114203.1 NAD(P)-binding domain-containing protein [Microbacterium sp. LX3-4]